MFRLAPRSTLFPYTTLFRSEVLQVLVDGLGEALARQRDRAVAEQQRPVVGDDLRRLEWPSVHALGGAVGEAADEIDRKSTRLNSSHTVISYAVFCLKKKKYT